MSFTIPANLYKPSLLSKPEINSIAALALSTILLSAALVSSKQFAKREKQPLKKLESSLKLYTLESAPVLAINAMIEKTKRRFDNFGKQWLQCGADSLPHLIVSGEQRHRGEFIAPRILFLYIAGWIE